MKRLSIILLVVTLAGCLSSVFRDPEKVLDEIHADIDAGRHEDALEKLLWFHENATKYDETWSGVRAANIITWHEVAQKYPPAMEALLDARDEAEAEVRTGKNVLDSFGDYQGFNSVLGEDEKTRDLFVEFAAQHPDSAREAYLSVEPALLRLKDYALCGEYIRPDSNYRVASAIRSRMEMYDAYDVRDTVEKDSKYRLCLTVAILAQNDRAEEAQEFARKSRALWDGFEFHATLDRALEGIMPEYPSDEDDTP